MKIKYLLILFTLVIPSISFSNEDYVFHEPKSSPKELLIIVQQYISDKQIKSNDYFIELMSYDYIQQRWYFFYTDLDRSKDKKFTIIVNDDSSNEIKLIKG